MLPSKEKSAQFTFTVELRKVHGKKFSNKIPNVGLTRLSGKELCFMEQLGENLFYALPRIALPEDQLVLELLACLLAFVAHLPPHFVCGFPLGEEEKKKLKKKIKFPVTDCFEFLFTFKSDVEQNKLI